MEEDESLYNAMIIALSIGIVIVILTLIFMRPPPEYFSELYYTNHTLLPRFIEQDNDYSFQVTIANHEESGRTYPVRIFAEHDNLTQEIAYKEIYIEKDGKQEFTIGYSLPDFTKARIQTGFGQQEIHFFVYNKDKAMQYPEGIASLGCLPEAGEASELVIRARGTFEPNMKIRLDGMMVENTTLRQETKEFTYDVNNITVLDIVFDNDLYNATTKMDRNIYIDSITLDGRKITNMTFDSGTGQKAFDCEYIKPGGLAITSNGAMRVLLR
jgi:hypothetical protein